MLSTLLASATTFPEVELTFPNLFGGITLSYYQGFELFGIKIYWYGVLITIGVVLAYLYAMWRAKDFGLGKDRMFDVVFVALIMGFLGARIYYCVFQTLDPNSGMSFDIVTTFTTIRDGGLAIYGGVIGAILGVWIYSRIKKVPMAPMLDLGGMGLLIGQMIGRWGNFINREAFGGETTLPWRMRLWESTDHFIEVHPTFFYESFWNFVGLLLIVFVIEKRRKFDGENFLFYLFWYGLGRAWIEGLRTDSLYLFDWTLLGEPIRVSQLLSVILCVAAAAVLIYQLAFRKHKQSELYVNQVR